MTENNQEKIEINSKNIDNESMLKPSNLDEYMTITEFNIKQNIYNESKKEFDKINEMWSNSINTEEDPKKKSELINIYMIGLSCQQKCISSLLTFDYHNEKKEGKRFPKTKKKYKKVNKGSDWKISK